MQSLLQSLLQPLLQPLLQSFLHPLLRDCAHERISFPRNCAYGRLYILCIDVLACRGDVPNERFQIAQSVCLILHSIPQPDHLWQLGAQIGPEDMLQGQQPNTQLSRPFEFLVAVGGQIGQMVAELWHVRLQRIRQGKQCLEVRRHTPARHPVIDNHREDRPQLPPLTQAVLPPLQHITQ